MISYFQTLIIPMKLLLHDPYPYHIKKIIHGFLDFLLIWSSSLEVYPVVETILVFLFMESKSFLINSTLDILKKDLLFIFLISDIKKRLFFFY